MDNGSVMMHINALASLLESLVERSIQDELGPADGKLYMQLCDTLNEYSKALERSFRESNSESERDTTGGTATDPGPEGDRPADPDT
jgi:hypothetical protein